MGNATSGKAFSYFTVLSDSLLWVLKLQRTGFAKLLKAPLPQKAQRGKLLWERGVNYPVPSHPLPGSGEGDNRRVCVRWLSLTVCPWHCVVHNCGRNTVLTWRLCVQSSGQLLSSSHKRAFQVLSLEGVPPAENRQTQRLGIRGGGQDETSVQVLSHPQVSQISWVRLL